MNSKSIQYFSILTALLAIQCGDKGGAGTSPTDGGVQSTHDSGTTAGAKSSFSEQENGSCPSQPTKLGGTAAVGETCSTYADCAPSCCGCSASDASYLAAACINKKCADKSDTCWHSYKNSYCPSDPEPKAKTDGGVPDARDDDPPTSSNCVDGYASDCDNAGEHWTGSKCCVDGPVQCVKGYASDCDNADEHWTGSYCCVSGAGADNCVDGYASDCDNAGEHWTGSKCCVPDATFCVDGYASDCDNADEHWTGSKCCVAAVTHCVAGYASDCDNADEHWTGSLCCVANVSSCSAGNASDCDNAGEHWTGSLCCI